MSQIWNVTKDVSNMISAKQIKAARVFLDMEQKDLAAASGLSLPTIQRMEKLGVERSQAGNAEKVRRALEDAGVIFIAENGEGPGVRLRKVSAA
ncbi:MAG: transcriptional regulator [Acetobacteraceae bacterium]|nr:transcriptional regulator [Acetobacteraceae bacterium]